MPKPTRILGMHLVGANVSELVHEGVLAMEFKGSADDLARICHAHPSLSRSRARRRDGGAQAGDPQGQLIRGRAAHGNGARWRRFRMRRAIIAG